MWLMSDADRASARWRRQGQPRIYGHSGGLTSSTPLTLSVMPTLHLWISAEKSAAKQEKVMTAERLGSIQITENGVQSKDVHYDEKGNFFSFSYAVPCGAKEMN